MALQGAALALSKCALFKDFSETGLAILSSIAALKALPAGAPLFVEGMAADAFFVIKSGAVKITAKGENGGETMIGLLGVGQALGQLSLIGTAGTRLSTATAEGAAEVIEIRQSDFVKLQAQKPQACLKLMMAVATQIGEYLNENKDLLRAAIGK
jgi:CRP/FNR family transcriptional regulator, cyclic AMP receptor protein